MQRRDQGLKKRKGVPLQDPQNMALLVGGMGDEELLVPGEEEEEQAPPEEESTAAATSADASPPPPQLPLLTATCGMAVTSLRCSRDAVVQQIDAITGEHTNWNAFAPTCNHACANTTWCCLSSPHHLTPPHPPGGLCALRVAEQARGCVRWTRCAPTLRSACEARGCKCSQR